MLDQVGFLAPDWKDLLEILVVTAVFYRILLLLIGIYFIARVLNLDLLRSLLENLFEFGAIAALVVFQPELRSALAHLGQNRIWRRFFNRLEETAVAEEIAEAAEELARSKVGAIIAIEREVGVGEYAETGTPLQARVSAPLLNTIFSPYSPLHDGAVIVRGDMVVAAGAILPLTQFPVADKSMGTRHRAVVVVSEETSQISLAVRGRMERNLDGPGLIAALGAAERGGMLLPR